MYLNAIIVLFIRGKDSNYFTKRNLMTLIFRVKLNSLEFENIKQ